MEPVEKTKGAKVDTECLVVEVMHDCPAEKVEAAVDGGCLDEFDGEEGVPGEDVDVEELWGEGDGDDVGDEMFYRVGILCSESDGSGEAMVELVDWGVEERLVE